MTPAPIGYSRRMSSMPPSSDTAPRVDVRSNPGDADRPLVVVTGGSGLLGSALIERLIDDYRIVSIDLDGDPRSPSSVDFICTDLTDDDSVRRAFERIRTIHGDRIASLVHLAAYYDFAGEDSPLYEAVTVEGTRRILDALADFEITQFVFSSTMLVHEPAGPEHEISERDPIEASWPYPESKVETEQLLRDHPQHERMSTVVARLAGVYDEAGHSPPIVNQIRRIDGRWITSHFYPADLGCGQAFVHRDDAIDALVKIVERRDDLPAWFPVLVGEPDTVGYGELQDVIAESLYGREWPTARIPAPIAKVGAWVREHNPFGEDPFIRSWMVDRAGDNYDIDIERATEELGWRPRHRVDDVVPQMIERMRSDRDAWYAENDVAPPRRLLPA